MAPKNPSSAIEKVVGEVALSRTNAATISLMNLASDILLSESDEAEIQSSFTKELYCAPWKLRKLMNIPDDQLIELYLKLESVEDFKLSSGKDVKMVVASGAKNALIRLRFVESAGMRGNFTADKVGRKFVMTHTGEIATNKPQACQTYSFAWELAAK